MSVLIVTESEIPDLLPMHECIDVMARVLVTLGKGDAVLPLRLIMQIPTGRKFFGVMPGYLGDPPAFGLKAISVFPDNVGTELDSHIGAVLLFEPEHGRLLAIMDASTITGIRTAAVSGVATRLLAREDAEELAILGAGVQGHTHLEAMLCTRPIKRLNVWSRTPDSAQRLATRARDQFGIEARTFENARDAVKNADVICTTTASNQPVLNGEWLKPGVHINAVGSSQKGARELDTDAVKRSRLFVDRRESTLNESGDFLIPKSEGAIGDDHIIGELGDILLEKLAGRGGPDEITLFKSLGIAVEDVASAHHIYTKAVERGGGTWIDLGGHRHL